MGLIQGSSPLGLNESNIVTETLKTSGGVENQNVDSSVTPVVFSSTEVPAGKKLVVGRLLMYMEDSTAFTSDKFGGITALTNGWTMRFNGVETIIAKSNRELALFMYDITGNEIFGKSNQTLIGRFSFNRFSSNSKGVEIREGETFDIVVKDNLTGLDFLEAKIEGNYVDV
jgi:hypothetical protein